MLRIIQFVILWFVAVQSSADNLEVDLNGFRLQQYLSIVEPALGRPLQTIDQGDLLANAYLIDQNSYMVISHLKTHPYNIFMLQLTGFTTNAKPFMGLVLGDSKAKIIEVLGNPDGVENIQSPRVTKLVYKGRNYTLELDENDRLYSIQIFTTAGLMQATDSFEGEWADFKSAVLSKNISALLEMMKPDVEIYRGGKTLSINRPFTKFVAHPDSEFISALIGQSNSVLEQLTEAEPIQDFVLPVNSAWVLCTNFQMERYFRRSHSSPLMVGIEYMR